MWTHHFRLALRSLARDKSAAALGGLSLAVAVAACVLIALFVRHELSFDRAVPNADRISAVAVESAFGGEWSASLVTPYVLAGTLADEAPSVEAAATTLPAFGTKVLSEGSQPDVEVDFLLADSTFFDVFRLPALAGDPATALDRPGGAVVTASTARELFGPGSPVGRDFQVSARGDTLTLTVRAVVADLPQPSTLSLGVVAPVSDYVAQSGVSTDWGSRMWRTFALRRSGTEPADLDRSLAAVTAAHGSESLRFLNAPLLDLRLSEFSDAEGFGGDPVFVRLFSAVAALILLLGAINYVNLATARAGRRAKEVGVQKALGAGRGALVRQFLVESVVLSALAGVAGLALAAVALPAFNGTFGTDLALGALDGPFLVGLGGAVLAVGLLAGAYPALFLSAFDPGRVLRGGAASQAAGEAFLSRTWLRRGLVVFQFTAAVLLLIGTGAVAGQLDYVRSKPLGLEPDGLVVVPITDPTLASQSAVVKRAFLQSPHVVGAAGAAGVPPRFWFGMRMSPDLAREDLAVNYSVVDGDADYADVVGLTLAAGRWYSDDASDAARATVVNEAFADALGWTPAEAVGREVTTTSAGPTEIVGVVRDFHFSSLREPVGPVVLGPTRDDGMSMGTDDYGEVVVRLAPGHEAEGLTGLRATWADLAGEAPFEPRFVADDFAELSAGEERLARTFGLFALVAVLIAALGLVGLAAYTAERRRKEVGIRRALGASVAGLVGLLSREYLALVAVAALLATPVAVVLVGRWLEGFAYRAPLSPLVVVGAAVAVLALALASVGVQALRAARRDPVRALRSE